MVNGGNSRRKIHLNACFKQSFFEIFGDNPRILGTVNLTKSPRFCLIRAHLAPNPSKTWQLQGNPRTFSCFIKQ